MGSTPRQCDYRYAAPRAWPAIIGSVGHLSVGAGWRSTWVIDSHAVPDGRLKGVGVDV
jgi:hypothetical protein